MLNLCFNVSGANIETRKVKKNIYSIYTYSTYHVFDGSSLFIVFSTHYFVLVNKLL